MDESSIAILPKWFWPLVVICPIVHLILLSILVLRPDEPAHEAAHVTPKKPPATESVDKIEEDNQIKPLPMLGDETSLVRIEANRRQYVGTRFILCGAVTVELPRTITCENRYDIIYVADSHYSLKFCEVDKNGQFTHARHLYTLILPRALEGSSRIINEIVETEERDSDKGGRRATRVRVHATISPLLATPPNGLPGLLTIFEVLNIEFLTADGKRWGPLEIRK